MVDLGLSVKWAPYNVGASSPGSNGYFYCWGETFDKLYGHVYNYKYYDPLADGYIDIGDQISGTKYDVAKELWGKGWRMPTREEMQELVDECTWETTSSGYKVTGPNGNSIFLTASGMMTYRGMPRGSSESGLYWCGDADVRVRPNGEKMESNASALRFNRNGYALDKPKVDYFSRAGGIQVRAVHD